MGTNLYIGIDMGGTKTAFGLIAGNGKLIKKLVTPTFPDIASANNPKFLVQRISKTIEELSAGKKLSGIGLASAGPMNVLSGELLNPTHFPDWKKLPIIKLLKAALAKAKIRAPLCFQNDAIAAALGEGWLGAARNLNSYVVVTVGTGIGTGVILNGQPAQSGGMGSELGLGILDWRTALNAHDPWAGTCEAFASGTGMLARARELGYSGNSLRDLVPELNQNKKYKAIFQDMAGSLAVLCHNLSLAYNPETIVFSGGIVKEKKLFWDDMILNYKKLLTHNPMFLTKIKIARLGNEAGMFGAARLAAISKNFF